MINGPAAPLPSPVSDLPSVRAARERWGIKVVRRATAEPISIDMARKHLNLTPYGSPPEHPDDWWLVNIGIPSAREMCEAWTGRAFTRQTFEVARGLFPSDGDGEVRLPMSPIIAVESFVYVDSDGVEQTVDAASYDVDTYGEPGAVFLRYGQTWPSVTGLSRQSVRVRYIAGYTVPGESPDENPIPTSLVHAMLLVLGHFYEYRNDTTSEKLEQLPLNSRSLMAPYKIQFGMA